MFKPPLLFIFVASFQLCFGVREDNLFSTEQHASIWSLIHHVTGRSAPSQAPLQPLQQHSADSCPNLACIRDRGDCGDNILCAEPYLACVTDTDPPICYEWGWPGAVCAHSFNCRTGFCQYYTSRTCGLPLVPGDRCGDDIACIYGRVKCNTTDKTCEGLGVGETYRFIGDCAVGLVETNPPKVCVRRVPLGEQCNNDTECGEYASCFTNRTCIPDYSQPNGVVVTHERQCLSSFVDPTTKTCRDAPNVRVGSCTDAADCTTDVPGVLGKCECTTQAQNNTKICRPWFDAPSKPALTMLHTHTDYQSCKRNFCRVVTDDVLMPSECGWTHCQKEYELFACASRDVVRAIIREPLLYPSFCWDGAAILNQIGQECPSPIR
jgi:hypothetical protein